MPHAPVLTVTLIMGDNYFNADMDYRIARENHRESTNMSQKRWTVLQELSMLSSSPIQDIINNFTVLAEIQPQPLHRAEDRAVFFISFLSGLFIRFFAGTAAPLLRIITAPISFHPLPATFALSFSAPDRI